jgi:hypothetical protein
MAGYVLYRDGEEFEVGWFREMLDRASRFWKDCKQTDWKNYFKTNGPGEVTWKKFTGWKEMPNDWACAAQWIIAVRGGFRGGGSYGDTFYRNITAKRMAAPEATIRMKSKVADAEKVIDLYADPECSCRLGFHRRCKHHGTTKN